MTCIAAIAHGPHVTMGGDSAISYVGSRIVRANSKVVQAGQFVIGFSGVARTLDIVLYSFEPPALGAAVDRAGLGNLISHDPSRALDSFMANQFSEGLREMLNKYGALGKDKDSEMSSLGESNRLLVGVLGQIYFVDCVLSCHRIADPFYAVGSGGDLALGSLFTSQDDPKLDPAGRIRKALEAATKYSESVCGPFHIVTTEPTKNPPTPA